MPEMQQPEHSNDVDPRVTFALERTLLAWTRTSLALMGFGFVVARLGLFLHEINPNALSGHGRSRWIGVSLVVLGALVQILALVEHRRRVASCERANPSCLTADRRS